VDHESVDSVEEEGRLSNPVKRRPTEEKIVQLIEDYVNGLSINEVARQHGIHRTTVMNHLESRGVQRRRILRKLSSRNVANAARRYANGASLASVAKEFGVSATTIAREFHAAGVRIKPRRGWAERNLSR
jgi:transposase-like protein